MRVYNIVYNDLRGMKLVLIIATFSVLIVGHLSLFYYTFGRGNLTTTNISLSLGYIPLIPILLWFPISQIIRDSVYRYAAPPKKFYFKIYCLFYHVIDFGKRGDLQGIRDWCKEEISGDHIFGVDKVLIARKKDAILFKMRWI